MGFSVMGRVCRESTAFEFDIKSYENDSYL